MLVVAHPRTSLPPLNPPSEPSLAAPILSEPDAAFQAPAVIRWCELSARAAWPSHSIQHDFHLFSFARDYHTCERVCGVNRDELFSAICLDIVNLFVGQSNRQLQSARLF